MLKENELHDKYKNIISDNKNVKLYLEYYLFHYI